VRPVRLVVGLGNPGPDYAGTRHNAGFEVVDCLAARLGAAFDGRIASSEVAAATLDGVPLAVARPQTYMNRSGRAVAGLLAHYGLEPADLLVVTDDLSLPVGQIRLRPKGGDGGHNGLADIAVALGSTVYPRLRVGVGNSFAPGEQVAYVLAPVPADERPVMDDAVDRAADAATVFAREGLVAAMNHFNRR
jgi:PTH1 family peptidyl-tRNA hydrolase